MARRGQKEGSIYKRQDGRWTATISLGYRNGRRWRKSFYGKTRDEVQRKLTPALRDAQLGITPPPERQTLAQFLENWLETAVKPSVRPLTYERYEQLVRLYIKPALGHERLTKLSPQAVQAFLNKQCAAGLSARTVQYMHATLRRALGQALKWGHVQRNVATLVDAPRVERREVAPLTVGEARKLLNQVESDRIGALYSVALAVGLRKGEALGLRWEDVDLEAGTVRIVAALQRVGGRLQLVEPKSKRSRRTVSVPNSVLESLRRHRTRQLEERVFAGAKWQEHGLVFTTTIGTPIDPRNVTRHFRSVIRKAGLPAKRFHDLRHTCASLLLAQNVHARVVMEMLGHSQIQLTLDTYSHVVPSLQRDAADLMDGILKG